MYVDLMPCADCARGVIQAGITEVVVSHDRMRAYAGSFYAESQKIAEVLLEEAGVLVRRA
jgi:deoxycytidylate deaminase